MSKKGYLRFNILTLKLLMLWPPKGQMTFKYSSKSSLLLLIINVSAWTCFYGIVRAAFIESDGYDALIQRIIALIDFAGCLYMRYCFLRKIQDVNALIRNLDEFKQFCPEEKINRTDEKVEYYSKAMMVYCLFGNLINSLVPLFSLEECTRQRKSDLYRQRDPCGLMARCFYPFDVSKELFPMAYFIQVYTCTFICFYVVILTMTLVALMMHTLNQLEYCRTLINNFDKETVNETEHSMRKLTTIILYHVKIIKKSLMCTATLELLFYDSYGFIEISYLSYCDKINEAFSPMMMLHLTLTSLVISALGFEILIVDNLTDSFRFSLHLLGWLMLLLLICYYGQILIDESVAVAEDIYSVLWYQKSVKIQKTVFMILMRSQKPLILSAANMGDMSFPTFLKVISSAYSYFTLLLNIKS